MLLDAAEEVFAKQGFGGAALEDIAEVAGYTRGAIYSHFGAKEELFLVVIERHLQRFLDGFADVITSFDNLRDLDVAKIAQRWRELTIAAPDAAALGLEFSLFLLRNPDARHRLAIKREETARSLAGYITDHVQRLGGTLAMPAQTLAHLLIAINHGITINGRIDGVDLFEPCLRMVLANVVPGQADPDQSAAAEAGITPPRSHQPG